MDAMRSIMRTLKLTVNEEKTHICRLPDESFDFLGYTFGRCYSKTGMRYIGQRPSKKKIQAICRQISEWTGEHWCWLDVEEQVGRLNRMMVGWANYFCQGPVTNAYRTDHQPCPRTAPSVVVSEAQGAGSGIFTFPGRIPAPESWV